MKHWQQDEFVLKSIKLTLKGITSVKELLTSLTDLSARIYSIRITFSVERLTLYFPATILMNFVYFYSATTEWHAVCTCIRHLLYSLNYTIVAH